MSQRILDHLKRIEDYSGKHVSVTDDVVYVNKKPVYTGEASGQYTGAMRLIWWPANWQDTIMIIMWESR